LKQTGLLRFARNDGFKSIVLPVLIWPEHTGCR
jgi:hypothetical protein